ncbi:MAG: hypothetical protein B7Z75_10440 [Acidocella sp. 20-57-95]|nr:MAG: hypothetical protein B7Z75_10440 [Acidocella sp. 20-57-95]OYV58864.1 MAG: hypothetical protein B7Z71_09270 [Acidocella sp. 21-58-7]HQT62976.1 hypothetical protein [Acidocella sp.]HQU05042.1 hypothetical protein [Acidocella sp.]
MKRRHFIAAAVAGYVLPAHARADALAGVGAASLNLLVAGPDGEQTSRWANAVALAMSAGFPGSPNILTQPVGGLDGVTGANRLDALVEPDGKTAAILPGAALIAWLTGDSRVHFDPTRWAPVMAGSNSGVLVVRLGDTVPSLAALQNFGTLRLAADQPESNDLPALIALNRMGVKVAPIFGLRGTAAKTKAFVAGDVDAVFLCGEGVPEDVAPLTANGGAVAFSIGRVIDGAVQTDPLFPGVPEATAFAPAASLLDSAYKAAAAAARLDYFVVLPRLSDSSALAAWRQAADSTVANPAMVAAASASSVVLHAAGDAIAELNALSISAADQAGLQTFLAAQFGWHAG